MRMRSLARVRVTQSDTNSRSRGPEYVRDSHLAPVHTATRDLARCAARLARHIDGAGGARVHGGRVGPWLL